MMLITIITSMVIGASSIGLSEKAAFQNHVANLHRDDEHTSTTKVLVQVNQHVINQNDVQDNNKHETFVNNKYKGMSQEDQLLYIAACDTERALLFVIHWVFDAILILSGSKLAIADAVISPFLVRIFWDPKWGFALIPASAIVQFLCMAIRLSSDNRFESVCQVGCLVACYVTGWMYYYFVVSYKSLVRDLFIKWHCLDVLHEESQLEQCKKRLMEAGMARSEKTIQDMLDHFAGREYPSYGAAAIITSMTVITLTSIVHKCSDISRDIDTASEVINTERTQATENFDTVVCGMICAIVSFFRSRLSVYIGMAFWAHIANRNFPGQVYIFCALIGCFAGFLIFIGCNSGKFEHMGQFTVRLPRMRIERDLLRSWTPYLSPNKANAVFFICQMLVMITEFAILLDYLPCIAALAIAYITPVLTRVDSLSKLTLIGLFTPGLYGMHPFIASVNIFALYMLWNEFTIKNS